MKESRIAVGEVPSAEFPNQTKKGPTGDEEEARHHRHLFRGEVARAMKLKGGKLNKESRLIYSGGTKLPDKPHQDLNKPDLGNELVIRA